MIFGRLNPICIAKCWTSSKAFSGRLMYKHQSNPFNTNFQSHSLPPVWDTHWKRKVSVDWWRSVGWPAETTRPVLHI